MGLFDKLFRERIKTQDIASDALSASSSENSRKSDSLDVKEWVPRDNALVDKGRLEHAITAFHSALPVESGKMDAETLSTAATAATNAADYDQAEKLCQLLLREFPKAFDGHECLAYLRESQGRHEEAQAHYARAIETAREYPEQTNPRLIPYLTVALQVQKQIQRAQSTIKDLDRLEQEMLAYREKFLPVLSCRWSADETAKGLPLGLSVHLFKSLGHPVAPELAKLRQLQVETIAGVQRCDSAIAQARVARQHSQESVSEGTVLAQRNRMSRGGPPDSLDAEVAAVADDYVSKSISVTLDEIVGIAVARIYARLRRERASRPGEECLRIVTQGRFALAESANCAVDCVFDPRLRLALSLRAQASGGSLGSSEDVAYAYGEVVALDPAGGTVHSVSLKEPARLRRLPEHILHSVVVCYRSSRMTVGHAVRIAALEDDGIRAMEGNYDGALRVGRFVPFTELTTASGNVLVLHRRPPGRFGFFSEPLDELGTASEALISLESVMGRVDKEELLKVEEDRVRTIVADSAIWRRLASAADTLRVLRMRRVMGYDMVRPEEVVSAVTWFGGNTAVEVVEQWLRYAANNPTGLIVALGPARIGRIPAAPSQLPGTLIREIGMPNDPEGRHYLPLDALTEILGKLSNECTEDQKGKLGLVHGLTQQQFADLYLDDELKQLTWVMTPHVTDNGTPVVVERYWELEEMKILTDQPGFLGAAVGASWEPVSIFDLLNNQLRALVILGFRIFLEPFVGKGCALSSADHEAIDSIGVRVTRGSEP